MAEAPAPPGAWQGRALTLEAMAWLILARALVARVPFARWRARLGTPDATSGLGPGEAGPRLAVNLPARRLARAVDRAAGRVPGTTKCLPRAMALQWMLARRGLGGSLHLGVSPGDRRGGLDDLHAWVSRGGEVLIGGTASAYAVIYVATFAAFGR
ncbi:MAG: lasso peptide biosynthesis B2 protein [Novosphingobium sp.]